MIPLILGCTLPTPPPGSPAPPGLVRQSADTGAVPAGAGTWQTLAPLPAPRQEVGVVAVDNEVWVLGGVDRQALEHATVFIYTPGSDRWREGPALPTPLHHLNVAVVAGDVFVLGGLTGSGFNPVAEAWVLRNGATSWTPLAPLPQARGAAAIAAVGSDVFVVGGLAGSTVADSVRYDTVLDTYTPLPPLPAARDHAAASGGAAFRVFGGRDRGLYNVRDEVFEWDGTAWITRARLPTPRAGTASAAFLGRTLVIGGEGNVTDPSGVFREVEAWDPDTDSWTALASLPTPTHGTGAAVVDGMVVVPGGAAVAAFQATDRVQALVFE